MNPVYGNWLAKKSPEVWHELVMSWGEWDGDLSAVEWILQQPNCDRATAIVAFGAAEAAEWTEFPDRAAVIEKFGQSSAVRCFDLCAMIIRLWKSGHYKTSTFAYPGLDPIHKKMEADVEPDKLPWVVPLDMFEDSVGAQRDYLGTARKIQKELEGLGLTIRGTERKKL